MGATFSESEYHLPILQVAQDDPQEPLWNLHCYQDPHYYVVVSFIKRLLPVCQEINDSCWFIRIISLFKNEIDDGDEGVRAR